MTLGIDTLLPWTVSKTFDLNLIMRQGYLEIRKEINLINSDTLFVHSMQNLNVFFLGPYVCFDEGGIAMG